MTAARPRVEGVKLRHLRGLKVIAEGPGFRPASMSYVTPTEYREQAERFVAALEDDNTRLTAEVARLRGVILRHADGLDLLGNGVFARSLRAALALPTNAPEATDG